MTRSFNRTGRTAQFYRNNQLSDGELFSCTFNIKDEKNTVVTLDVESMTNGKFDTLDYSYDSDIEIHFSDAPESNTVSVLIGDIDMDGDIRIKDFESITSWLLGRDKPTWFCGREYAIADGSGKNLLVGDINLDGWIDSADAGSLLSFNAGFERHSGYAGQEIDVITDEELLSIQDDMRVNSSSEYEPMLRLEFTDRNIEKNNYLDIYAENVKDAWTGLFELQLPDMTENADFKANTAYPARKNYNSETNTIRFLFVTDPYDEIASENGEVYIGRIEIVLSDAFFDFSEITLDENYGSYVPRIETSVNYAEVYTSDEVNIFDGARLSDVKAELEVPIATPACVTQSPAPTPTADYWTKYTATYDEDGILSAIKMEEINDPDTVDTSGIAECTKIFIWNQSLQPYTKALCISSDGLSFDQGIKSFFDLSDTLRTASNGKSDAMSANENAGIRRSAELPSG